MCESAPLQGLVASVLELMGLKEGEVGENDSLADLGLDSLQLVEIRSKVQTAIGRPLPLEQARPSTACPDALPLCALAPVRFLMFDLVLTETLNC